jgi:hypothetical protein
MLKTKVVAPDVFVFCGEVAKAGEAIPNVTPKEGTLKLPRPISE